MYTCSAVFRGCSFFHVIHSLWFYNLSTCSSTGFPKLWMDRFDGDFPFGTWYSKVSLLSSEHCPSVGFCFCSHLLLEVACLMVTEPKQWSVSKTEWHVFQQNSGIWCYPVSMTYLVSGSWLPHQCRRWVLSWEMERNSNQLLVGFSHKPCATVVLLHLGGRSAMCIKRFVAGLVFYFSFGSI